MPSGTKNIGPSVEQELNHLRTIGHRQLWPTENVVVRESKDCPPTLVSNGTVFHRNVHRLEEYLRRILTKPSTIYNSWINCLYPGKRCNPGLIYAGLPSESYPSSFKVLEREMVATLRRYIQIESRRTVRGKAVPVSKLDISVTFFADSVRKLCKPNVVPTVFIPWYIPDQQHWGCIAAIPPRSNMRGGVWWGDSLNIRPECQRVLEVVKYGMVKLDPVIDLESSKSNWEIYKHKQNYILDVLKYQKQENGHSCGFYVVAAAWSFANTNCCSGLEKDDLEEYTEYVRAQCIQTYVSALLQNSIDHLSDRENGIGYDDNDILDLLINPINNVKQIRTMIKAPQSENQCSTLLEEEGAVGVGLAWPEERLNNVRDLSAWMRGLNDRGFFTAAKVEDRRIHSVGKKSWEYNYHLHIRCVEYKRKRKCPAKVVCRSKGQCGPWMIDYKGLHNHELLSVKERSVMHTRIFKDLERFSTRCVACYNRSGRM